MSAIEPAKGLDEPGLRLLERFTLPVWRSGLDAKCDYVNKTWLEFTGRTLEQELGEGWLEDVHPEDRAECLAIYLDAFHSRRSFLFEYRLQRYDGEYRWLMDCGSPFDDSAGHFAGYLGVCYDITPRKEAEQALRKSEKLFAAFMSHWPGYAWMKDLEGRYTYANAILAQLEPYREGWLGKTDADLWPAEIASAVRANDETVIATAKPLQAIEQFLRDNEVSQVLVSKFPIFDSIGAVEMVGGASIDITEKKQAEKALAEQVLCYRTLMETSTDSIYVIDTNGDLQEANAEFLRRRGYSAAEVKGLNVADLDAQWTRDELQEKLIGSSAVFETRHRCKDGSVFDVEVGATSVQVADKQLFFCVTRDITERKRVEARAAQFVALVESSEDAIIGKDLSGTVTSWNHGAEKIFGYSASEMLGRSITQLIPPGRQHEEEQVLSRIRQGESVEHFETVRITKDGREIDISLTASPIKNTAGDVVGVSKVARDIREWKRDQDRLRRSEERFRQIAENINEVFWVWTATPGKPRLLYVSPAYETIWGRSCESLYSLPQSWKEALHPQDKGWVLAKISHLDVEVVDDLTYRIVRPDQSVRWIRDRIFPMRDAKGLVVRLAGIAQDITESKEAEEAVHKANRQLQVLSRRRIQEQEDERRRLSRELHDQIGQALAAAKINVEVLRLTTAPGLLERVDETITILDRLLGQVRQISLDLRPPMLDDLGLVPALRSLLDQHGRRASVFVHFSAANIPEDLDPEIQTTCFRIAQEAITNAVRHANAAQIDVDLRCANGNLRLLIRDNGRGFDVGSAQAQTIDLGLIGMKERAALVGGHAKVVSSPNKGTTIEVLLPAAIRGGSTSGGPKQ